MRKQTVNQTFEINNMEAALESLLKGIARWTDREGLLETAIPTAMHVPQNIYPIHNAGRPAMAAGRS